MADNSRSVQFVSVFRELFTPARYKVFKSGRGAAKTYQFAIALVLLSRSKKMLILCAREFQNSIQESVYSVLVGTIFRLGVAEEFTVLKTEIVHKASGSRFIFKGLHHHIHEIKSFEGVDIVWIEEAATISQESMNILFPTIRKDGSEIWISYNQDLEEDPVDRMFFTGGNVPPNTIAREVNWRDNPWFPKELADLREYDFKRDPLLAEWIWEKSYRPRNRYMVYDSWVVEQFESPPMRDANYRRMRFRYGLDFGFGADPCAANRVFTKDNVLYIDYEFHGDPRFNEIDLDYLVDGLPGNASPVEKACPGIMESLEAYADSSQPQSIAFLNRRGFSLKPCTKKPGSVEDGIQFVRAFDRIVVHPRCEATINEFKLYRYRKIKSTDEVISEPEDAHNHHMDAIRYALNEDIYDSGAIEIPAAAAKAMLARKNVMNRNRRRRVI